MQSLRIKAAGVPEIRIHDLRHTFASQLVIEGVPLNAVKEMLGHATIEMTMRYAHLAPGASKKYVELMDRARNRQLIAKVDPS